MATALSGPRRISAGAVRDSLIGLRLVNGRGEIVFSGGRVMKNVTGLDLVKINCGAHGTLGLILEATFKLLPRPEAEATIVIRRLDDAAAIAAMTRALGSPFGVSGAATIHAGMGREFPRTLIRIEGFRGLGGLPRREADRAARRFRRQARADAARTRSRIWRAIRDVEFLAEPRERAIWRVEPDALRRAGSRSSARVGTLAQASVVGLRRRAGLARDRPHDGGRDRRVRGARRGLAATSMLIRADETLRA